MGKYWDVNLTAVSKVFVSGAETAEKAIELARAKTQLPLSRVVEESANELTKKYEINACRRYANEKVDEHD